MNQSILPDLTLEEIEILISECDEQIDQVDAELLRVLISRDKLKRQLLALKNERDMLDILKTGYDFNKQIKDIGDQDTLKLLKQRYKSMSNRLTKLFNNSPDKNISKTRKELDNNTFKQEEGLKD